MKAQQLTAKVRAMVHARSTVGDKRMCEVCGTREAQQIHHRTGRQMGGSRQPWINLPGNLLDVCYDPCHEKITRPKPGMTDRYRSLGWLVRRGITRPSEIPVYMWHDSVLGWWLLEDDGECTQPTAGERIEASMLAAYSVPLDDDSDRYHDRCVDMEVLDG